MLLLAATTGYQIRAFGDAAERLGVDLVYATDRCNVLEDPWQDRAIAIRFSDEAASASMILEGLKTKPVDGVLAVGDRPTVIAAHVAASLGLRWHPPAAASAARNKRLTRQRLRDAGLLVPWFLPMAITADTSALGPPITFPCVVKPLALSGSRGVIRANEQSELVAAFYRLRSILQAPEIRAERNPDHGMVLVEGFIDGPEFAVEGLLDEGQLNVLAIFDKPDPLDGPFFEETLYVTPSAASGDVKEAIADAVRRAAAALGLDHGPIHAECRVHESGVYVLEVAARPIGGLCARALRFVPVGGRRPFPLVEDAGVNRALTAIAPVPESTGEPLPPISLEELLLRHALGESSRNWRREPQAAGVMMIPIPRRGVFRDVIGLDAARATPDVFDVRITAKTEQVLIPLPDGGSYLGFIFARADSAARVERALRVAHQHLDFAIDPEVPMLQSLHG